MPWNGLSRRLATTGSPGAGASDACTCVPHVPSISAPFVRVSANTGEPAGQSG